MMELLPKEAEEFLRQLRQGLASLPQAERQEIVEEIRSHLRDRQAAGEPLLAGFEDAQTYASRFVSETALRGALAGGSSLDLGKALLTGARTGLVMLLAVVPLTVVQLIGAGLIISGALKPFMPSQVGLFLDGAGRFVALGAHAGELTGAREVLGFWAMPLFLGAGILLLFAGNRALRALARRRLQAARER
jgi:uncharacterized membrane protein